MLPRSRVHASGVWQQRGRPSPSPPQAQTAAGMGCRRSGAEPKGSSELSLTPPQPGSHRGPFLLQSSPEKGRKRGEKKAVPVVSCCPQRFPQRFIAWRKKSVNPGGKNLPKRLTHLYLSQSKRFPKIFKNNCGDVYSGPKGGSGGAVGGSAVGRRQRCAGRPLGAAR